MKIILTLSFLLTLCLNAKAQEKNIDNVILQFSYFKYPDTEYKIDYKKNELTSTMKLPYRSKKDTLFHKTYTFTNNDFKSLKEELNKNIPDSIIRKSESAYDGGGFTINYMKKIGDTSKIIVRNPYRNGSKYTDEFKKIDAFFDFAYSVVKDSLGVKTLDNTIRPYYTGLPIRKISENPLEYKMWGSISGNATWKNELIPFLEKLPKDKCVIINCDNQLSYAWQEDILRLYILKNSNIHFAKIDYLKFTRKYLIEFKEKIKNAGNNEEKINELKKTTTYDLYMNNKDEINKWLKLPEKLIYTTVEEYRKNCR